MEYAWSILKILKIRTGKSSWGWGKISPFKPPKNEKVKHGLNAKVLIPISPH